LEERYRQVHALEELSSRLGDPGSSRYIHDSSTFTVYDGLEQNIRPLGFDRLLSQGFSLQDVASLRATFLTSLAQSRTTAQLPTGDDLRILEDQWLDSAAFDPSSGDHDEGVIGALDDLLIGFFIGFFWPIAGLWAFHEDGMWSERRRSAIWVGVVGNIVFGFIRYITIKMEGT